MIELIRIDVSVTSRLGEGRAEDAECQQCEARQEVKEEILGGGAALASLGTPHHQADHQDDEADQGGDDGGHGDAVGVLHQHGQTDHCQHVDDGPERDGQPGDGEDCDPDGEDGGESVAPAEDRDAQQADAVDLLGTGVVQTAGYQVGGEHDTLGVVASVGGQHDGREHGEVGGCQ